jgi:hypothetical protein
MTEDANAIAKADAELRALSDDEVDAVDGGLVVIAIIAVLIGLLVPAVQ